jgi:hypothetical protein
VRLRSLRIIAYAVFISTAPTCFAQSTFTPWLTRSANNSRSGWNPHETRLFQTSVRSRGLVRRMAIPVGDSRGMEAQPLIVTGVKTESGPRDVLVLASMSDVILGVDAHDGALIWKTALGTPINGDRSTDFWRINNHWGCISTGVVDPDAQLLYQVCWISPDSSGRAQTARYYLFSLRIADGREAAAPVLIDGRSNTQHFYSAIRKQRSSLVETSVHTVKTIFGCAGSVIETGAGAGGYCFAFDVITNRISAILSLANGRGAGIWMAGQGPAADADGNLYLTTSNGAFDGTREWGESFLKLRYSAASARTAATLTVVDHWTPWTDRARTGEQSKGSQRSPSRSYFTAVNSQWSDQDLGSAGPACIFPIQVCVVAGKDGIAYPIKTTSLGGTTFADLADPPANCAKLAGPAVWLTVDPGRVDPCPRDPRSLNFLPSGHTASLFMTPVQFYDPMLKSWTLFAWGANSQLRKWAVSNTGRLTFVAQGHEYASAKVRSAAPGGMPGGECSGSSHQDDIGSALLVCTVPYGDANRAVVSGRLLVYDPIHLARDGSLKVLWDSQHWGVQFSYNKFNPPIVFAGQIYVPTYDGQIDVYGLVDRKTR